jgi:UDP-glucose 4-epimerase
MQSKKKKIVLITGGAGFIGSHAVDLFLKKGYEVRSIDNLSGGSVKNIEHLKNNKFFKLEKADLLNLRKLKKFIQECQYIVHFAGVGDIVPSIENPKKYFENNVQGTVNLLDSLNISNVKKFVYAASSSCYGKASTPTSEKHKINPLYPYALSKYVGENICFHWNKVYRLPVNSIRIFNAYGTRSRTTGAYGAVFGVFLRQLIANKPLTVVGDGNQKRDFLYVTDVVEAFYKASTSKLNNKIWNLGSGKPQSVNKLIKILNPNGRINIPKRPGEPSITHANISKIKKDLNWEPKVSFEDGVSKILQNIDYWKNAPLWDKNKIKKTTKLWFKYLK